MKNIVKLSEEQFGFMTGRLTVDAIFAFSNYKRSTERDEKTCMEF